MSSYNYNNHTGYHNRRSIRLPGFDYSQPRHYFVTICIHDRKQRLFGDIINSRMIVHEYGKYAEQCWKEIPVHYPNVKIDEFNIMPNHVHGIIQLYEHIVENETVIGFKILNPDEILNPDKMV